jgi:hypothetical protein
MAVSKSDLLTFLADYHIVNKRPCAKNTIIAKYGEDAIASLKELVADASVTCRRGRNGGYYPIAGNAAVEARQNEPVEESAPAESEPIDTDALAEKFRALEARLAAEEAVQSETAAEPAPF